MDTNLLLAKSIPTNCIYYQKRLMELLDLPIDKLNK